MSEQEIEETLHRMLPLCEENIEEAVSLIRTLTKVDPLKGARLALRYMGHAVHTFEEVDSPLWVYQEQPPDIRLQALFSEYLYLRERARHELKLILAEIVTDFQVREDFVEAMKFSRPEIYNALYQDLVDLQSFQICTNGARQTLELLEP